MGLGQRKHLSDQPSTEEAPALPRVWMPLGELAPELLTFAESTQGECQSLPSEDGSDTGCVVSSAPLSVKAHTRPDAKPHEVCKAGYPMKVDGWRPLE